MNCPECGGAAVIKDSRLTEAGRWRRYHCSSCKTRFSSMEKISHIGNSSGRNPLDLWVQELRSEALDEIESELAHLLSVLRKRYNVTEEGEDSGGQ